MMDVIVTLLAVDLLAEALCMWNVERRLDILNRLDTARGKQIALLEQELDVAYRRKLAEPPDRMVNPVDVGGIRPMCSHAGVVSQDECLWCKKEKR